MNPTKKFKNPRFPKTIEKFPRFLPGSSKFSSTKSNAGVNSLQKTRQHFLYGDIKSLTFFVFFPDTDGGVLQADLLFIQEFLSAFSNLITHNMLCYHNCSCNGLNRQASQLLFSFFIANEFFAP